MRALVLSNRRGITVQLLYSKRFLDLAIPSSVASLTGKNEDVGFQETILLFSIKNPVMEKDSSV
jgi:hypothetical protein